MSNGGIKIEVLGGFCRSCEDVIPVETFDEARKEKKDFECLCGERHYYVEGIFYTKKEIDSIVLWLCLRGFLS